LLQKPFITSAIVSATNEKQLQELINATNLKLTNEQMKELDDASEY
jgi:aryl-alcohol dehydrogenase-like predicted oxidoreductase